MRLLLDTHTLLWWLSDPDELSSNARDIIGEASNEIYVSAASAWEISIKKRIGKLQAPDDLEIQIQNHRFTPLEITVRHALGVGRLPPLHRDPFDRMLVVQAQLEALTVATRDEIIPRYNVTVLEP